MVGIDLMVFGTWVFWLGLALVPLTALSADIVYKVVKRTCYRSLADDLSELDVKQQSGVGSSQYQSILTQP